MFFRNITFLIEGENVSLDPPHSGTMRTKVTSNQVLSAVGRYTHSRMTATGMMPFGKVYR